MKSLNVVIVMLFMAVGLVLTSCDKEAVETNNNETVVNSDSDMESSFEDIDDLASTILEATESNSGGRIAGEADDRVCEGAITFSGDANSGTIVIDFGAGCEDSYGNVRKGKINIAYTGGRFQSGSVVTTTLDGYSINDIAIEGTRTLTNITESANDYPTFSISLTGCKITWPNDDVATRTVSKVRVWKRASSPINDEVWITGEASGVTRRGVAYNTTITDSLVYKASCRVSTRGRLALAGTKIIETENKIITVDYGDGNCDRRVSIVVDGKSENVNLD
ncbi:hypothetical protein [Fulvivirga ligni]|uniref:hypothetical protein n=1 Tax=Fulvivirga ligni TaxID=2904246 RepID=UPI001F3727DA|nr:hypothetical protein [Fulvivirga ligni]UII19233.1 hypothetical protein LVD16_15415 [Fulvivirga ligni]